MSTEVDKSSMEIATEIVRVYLDWKDSRYRPLVLDINEALRGRDERAAQIAEQWLATRTAKSWTSLQTANGIASAIRDGD